MAILTAQLKQKLELIYQGTKKFELLCIISTFQ